MYTLVQLFLHSTMVHGDWAKLVVLFEITKKWASGDDGGVYSASGSGHLACDGNEF